MWIWSTLAARRALSHPLRTEHTPIDLTHTLLVLLISVLDCTSALGRVCWFHALYLLMAARQTSIISATAPPDPAFITNAEADPVAFTIPVAFTVQSFEPVPTHSRSLRHLHCLLVSVCKCRRDNPILLSSSTTQQIDPSLLTWSDLGSFSGT